MNSKLPGFRRLFLGAQNILPMAYARFVSIESIYHFHKPPVLFSMILVPTKTREALALLEQRYPRAFPRSPSRIRPLSQASVTKLMGLASELAIDAETLSNAIAHQTTRRPYIENLAASEAFIDLDGNDDGLVGEDTRRWASNWITANSVAACLERLESLEADGDDAKSVLEILSRDCMELRSQSAFLVGVRQANDALKLRELWHQIAVAIDVWAHSKESFENLLLAKLLRTVSEMNCELLRGDFQKARECISELSEYREEFDAVDSFFPNYFHKSFEIDAYELIINGVEKFSQAEFEEAKIEFEQWMLKCVELKGVYNSRYDSIEACFSISKALAKAQDGSAVRWKGWKQVDETFSDPKSNVWHTLWVLWGRVQLLMPLTQGRDKLTAVEQDIVSGILQDAVESWRLLLPYCPLSGPDRQKTRPVELFPPTFLDAQSVVQDSADCWQAIIEIMLRNALILKLDFEILRNGQMPKELHGKDTSSLQLLADETLIECVQFFFARKSRRRLHLADPCHCAGEVHERLE